MAFDDEFSMNDKPLPKSGWEDEYVDLSHEQRGVQEKATSIKLSVRVMELRLSGFEWDSKSDKYIYTGRVLCDPLVVNKATSLVQPFAEESNLITGKQFKTFSRQKWEVCSTFNKTLLAEIGCWSEHYEVIMKVFKNTVQNIGDVILSSKEVLKGWYGQETEYKTKDLLE